MFDKFKIITLSHHQTEPENVKYLVFPDENTDVYQQILTFKKAEDIDEMVYLSTCNRVLYLFYCNQSTTELESKLYNKLSTKFENDRCFKETWSKIKTLEGMEALKHYFRIASSMDSLVIGEREVFRQLREAYDQSLEAGLSGDHLRLVQQSTVKAAKRIYSDSRIGEKPVSIVSLAMRKFKERQLTKEAKIILIGAGVTIETVAKFLKADGYEHITIYNRTISSGEKIGSILGPSAAAKPLAKLEQHTEHFDCIISCTGAQGIVLTADTYRHIIGSDRDTKLLIDLAIPEDIERSIFDQFDAELISIGHLDKLAKANHEFRKKELKEAEVILDEEIKQFGELIHRRFIERAFVSVPKQIELIKQRALSEVFAKELEEVDEQTLDLINRMMDYMEKKCVSIPMKTAKEQYTLIKKSLSSEHYAKK